MFWKKKERPPKPEDRITFTTGLVCESHRHVSEVFDENKYGEGYRHLKTICKECGGPAQLAVIRRRAEAIWDGTKWAYEAYIQFISRPLTRYSYSFVRFLY